jgi:membrane protease YdiL (CAAX protease family)
VIYKGVRLRAGVWVGVLVSSVLFALAHIDSPAAAISAFILGIVNALLLERFRSLWVPIAVHVVNNVAAVFMLYLLMALSALLPMT